VAQTPTEKEGDMSAIDRQRIGAVRTLEALGYSFNGIEWNGPEAVAPSRTMDAEADAMHALLVLRADKLGGYTEGSDEELELKMIADRVGAYEAKRWPDGDVSRGKGPKL
jgi:hypothetical protein